MSKGYVYVLTNESMPGLLKIGRTIRCVDGRANELYQTGVPTPFKVIFSILSPDCEALEDLAHKKFAKFRVNPAREFFSASASDVLDYLQDEVRYQVECLVDEFLPDHVIVDPDLFVDLGGLKTSFYKMVDEYGLVEPDIAQAIYQLEGSEVEPAIARAKAETDRRIAANRAAREAKEKAAQFRGPDTPEVLQ